MRQRHLALAVVFAAACCGVAVRPALAQGEPVPATTAGVRTGDHAGFGRVVLDLGPGMRPVVANREQTVTVRVDSPAGPIAPAAGARAPRNVQSLAVRDGLLELTLVPGARLRSYRMGQRLVLDIADSEAAAPKPATPAAAAPPPSAATVSSPRATAVAPPSAAATASGRGGARISPTRGGAPFDPTRGRSADAGHRAREDARAAPPPPLPAIMPAPLEAVEVARLSPLGLSASLVPDGPPDSGAAAAIAVTLPFGPAVGAAALRRGDTALVVFDERRPIDMSALRADEVFGTASIALLPGATVLRLKLPPAAQVRLSRAQTGWTVAVVPADPHPASLRPIRAEAEAGRLRLHADAAGQVVAVPDPLSGSTMLIGTQKAEGQGVAVDRRSPEFALLSTWQGVALLPLTDALALRPAADGFVLAADAGRALSLSATESQTQAMTEAATASRRFDLPALPTEALHRRLQSARLAAASAPPQARTERRRAVAEALLALGMGAEMLAVLSATVAEDARAADDLDIAALTAIGAVLAGRTEQSAGIDDPRLDGTDEIAFWRAARAAQVQPGAPRPAAIFGSAMPLLLSYPTALRDRLLPQALETMAQGGEAAAARTVLARLPEQPALDLARAMVAERSGDAAAALARYDRIAQGSDRRSRAVAARQAVELRLASGDLPPAKAADALERLVYAWRGDGIEIATRLRVAELRAQSGAWRTALALLREMQSLFPEQDETARRALAETFARSLAPAAQEKLSPLDLVALAEENADLLPSGSAGYELAVRLADRLMALDLPSRALPALEKLIDQAPPGVARATLGASLAALRLEQGGPAGALDALSASMVEGVLPPDLLERRTLVFARAAADTGDLATAIATLAELGTPPALVLRATLLERAKDWPAASAALSALVRATLPATGPLNVEQSRLVLRLAAATAQAGDERALAGMRTTLAPRLAEEQMRDLASLLSAAPVQSVADLPRAAQEARLARSASAGLRATGPAAGAPGAP